MSSLEQILQMLKLNHYLDKFPVSEGVTGTKLSEEKLVDVLEDRVPLQWKLELKNLVLAQALLP
eukprot:1153881-Ditylum_brightwellii.AAC.1